MTLQNVDETKLQFRQVNDKYVWDEKLKKHVL
jgi:hypothetical protein